MNRTEKLIMNSFLSLLEKKPYNKITVKDIVEDCQVNRNTFYYHFHDIPDVLEKYLKED
ncbi:MAG: TetR family transcriptional regulator, partial [Floccifex sp.]